MIKHPHVVFMASLLLFSCNGRSPVEIKQAGQLDELIKNSDMSPHASLSDYADSEHLYAIGWMANLDGYVQIIDSKPYISYVTDSTLKIDSSFNGTATLFLYAGVSEWKEFDLPSDVTTWKQLEQFIGNEAVKYGVPKNKVSPFLLKGNAADASWRVIDWDPNAKVISYKKISEAGLHGHLKNEYITALGFYSREASEVLAHKETNMNIHFINHDHSIAGRLDDLVLDGRIKLYLPKILEASNK